MSAIKVGDLVMVVRGNACGCADRVGHPFLVTKIYLGSIAAICITCGHRWTAYGRTLVMGHPGGDPVNINRLIKIDPPAQPESVDRKEEVSV